jgi:hypothetical protein
MRKADKLNDAAKVVAMYVPRTAVGLLLQSKKADKRYRPRQGYASYQDQGVGRHRARPRQCRRIAKAAVAHFAVTRSLT